MEADPPQGFLFVCPATDFQTGPTSFQSPDCPGYWSLDPSGVERLSAADAANLGFPSITVSMRISGTSWDTSAYYALLRFHQGKGFDPESHDVARHLGYKLYSLSGDTSIPNAHSQSTFCQPVDTSSLDDEQSMMKNPTKMVRAQFPRNKSARILVGEFNWPLTIQLTNIQSTNRLFTPTKTLAFPGFLRNRRFQPPLHR